MADYKDIIAGTLSNIIGKVKDVADSAAVKDICEQGASRAKAYGRIAKLTLEMNGETEELKRVYTEIGRLYYEQSKDSPEGFFVQLFSQADEISRRLHAMEQEIQDMRSTYEAESGESSEPDIEVEVSEFEDVVDATESDGSSDKTEE